MQENLRTDRKSFGSLAIKTVKTKSERDVKGMTDTENRTSMITIGISDGIASAVRREKGKGSDSECVTRHYTSRYFRKVGDC